MDPFVENYIIAALWSSTDDKDEPLDKNYRPEDISCCTLQQMKWDCEDFQHQCAKQLEIYEQETGSDGGFDFWLTRNGHGAGFWDRGLGEIGDILTAVAHSFGSFDLYVGDDGHIYGS